MFDPARVADMNYAPSNRVGGNKDKHLDLRNPQRCLSLFPTSHTTGRTH